MEEQLQSYQKHIDQAIEWVWSIIPNLVLAIIILVVGLWVIRLINKGVARFFEKRTTKLLWSDSFRVSFITLSGSFCLWLLLLN